VCVVVVGYRNEAGIISCAKRVLASSYSNLFLIGIDNGSYREEGYAMLNDRFELRNTGFNAGFAGACNLGMKLALSRLAKYVLFLNDDALPDRECIKELVMTMEGRTGIGLLCPAFLSSSKGAVETVGGRYNGWIGLSLFSYVDTSRNGVTHALVKTDYAPGAALMFSADALRTTGGLDERYFMYVEDLDMTIRMKRSGFLVACFAKAFVHHESSSTSNKYLGLKQYYMMRNRFILCWLLGMRAKLITVALSSPWVLLLRLLKDFRRLDVSELWGFVYGVIDGLKLEQGPSKRREYAPP
jgi:GT2 family glycosyltransferase